MHSEFGFHPWRGAPLPVLALEAGMPLVHMGGGSLHELREDVFDAAFNTCCRAGCGVLFNTYTAAMMGGEPYSEWW